MHDKYSFDLINELQKKPREEVIIEPEPESARDKQIGGQHYKHFQIQPAEYSEANKLSFLEGNVVKYVSRWRFKDGLRDLDKAIHCLELLKEMHESGKNV